MSQAPGGPRSGQIRQASLLLVGLSFVGFVSLGLPDGLLGVAWPSMRRDFQIPLDALGGLFISVVAGYLLASVTSGRVVGRLGVGLVLALSCLLTAASRLGIAAAPGWPVVVGLGFATGLGAGAIDAGLNAFAALNFSPRLVNWLHASYGIGVTVGPALLGVLFDAGLTWRWGYGIVGAAQSALGLAFLVTLGRWTVAAAPQPIATVTTTNWPLGPSDGHTKAGRRTLLALGAGLFFAYTGLEVAAGGWAYSLLVEARGMEAGPASLAVSTFWAALAGGRVVFGTVANRLDPVALVRWCTGGMILGALLMWLNAGAAPTVLGLAIIGFAAAPVYPALISATPSRVGTTETVGTTDAVGLQVGAAALGGALLPGLAGILAERASLEILPPFLVGLGALMVVLHEGLVRRSH